MELTGLGPSPPRQLAETLLSPPSVQTDAQGFTASWGYVEAQAVKPQLSFTSLINTLT